jgi:integrase/recombinase XerC
MARPGRPWFKASHGRWYAKIGGRLVNLGAIESEAWAEFARLRAELVQGVANAVVGKIGPQTTNTRPGTVAELVPAYLRAADVQADTRGEYASRLRWLVLHFGGVSVAELDAGDVSAAGRGETWTANTRRQTLTVCQQFVRWAGRKDWSVKMPAMESRGDEAIVTRDEYTALLAVARGDFRPLLKFIWLVGCRPGEACRLTVDAVDWSAGVAVLKQHKTARKGKRRTLFLGGEALAVLSAQRQRYGVGPLFRGRYGEAFTPDRVTERFGRAVAAAGLRDNLTAYCFRHAFATRMLEAGVSPSDVAALLGHSGTAVLEKTYSHLMANTRRLRDVAGRLDGAA